MISRNARDAKNARDQCGPAVSRCLGALCAGDDLVETLLQRVPREGCAFDTNRKLHHALKRLEVAEPDTFEIDSEIAVSIASVELRFMNRHQRLERADQLAHLVQ